MKTSTRIVRTRTRQVGARVTALTGVTRRADTSKQMYLEDEFKQGAAGSSTSYILPPYDTLGLLNCIDRSNTIRQCISAYVTNIAMSGFAVAAMIPGEDIDAAEKAELESFISSPNSEETLRSIQEKMVNNYEEVGYCFLEVIRDRKERVSLLRHIPSHSTRLLPKSKETVKVTYEINRGKRVTTAVEHRAFRRYVQIINGRSVYFKEFGDPRVVNCLTGEYDDTCADVDRATEVIHVRQHSADSYGVPRWVNQLPSVLGSREVEECNLRYFEDNTVPPMILSVAGGRLTAQSFNSLTAMLNSEGIGKDRQNRIMLIEAIPEREGLDDKGSVSLKIDKLTDARPSDGLFKEYDQANQAKVRSSFRLPPVIIGMSQDVTFATANVSAFIAETQVFAPLRNMFDEIYNKQLVNHPLGLNLKTCKLVSQVPTIANPETLISSLTALNVMGAVTPRTANEAANQLLQIDLPSYPEKGEEGYEDWMDQPIQLAMKSSSQPNADPLGSTTHAEQGVKSPAVKAVEGTGDVSMKPPEHGKE